MKNFLKFTLICICYKLNAANQSITSNNFLFSPNAVTINSGEKVSFTNVAGFHFVEWLTAPGTLPANSANLSAVAIEYTLTTPGTYTFQCGFHPSMLGTIIVEQNALPIRLQTFDLKIENQKHILKWTTETEQNTSYFIVEAAYDQLNFNEIGRQKANGSSNEVLSYQYEYQPFISNKKNIYYRLKTVDIDGKFEYSSIIALKLGNHDAIKIYPNPVSNVLILEGFGHDFHQGNSLVSIVNETGKLSLTPKELTENDLITWYDFNVSTLIPGKYFVQISNKLGYYKTIPFIVNR
jgi:plastocyanin